MDEDDLINSHPFDDPQERQRIRVSADKADKTWTVIGPIHAVVSNWKALAVILAILTWVNKPEIIAALTALAGGGK